MQDIASEDITIIQAAEILGCSVRTVARLQSDGLLQPVYRESLRGRRKRFFRRSEVAALSKRAA